VKDKQPTPGLGEPQAGGRLFVYRACQTYSDPEGEWDFSRPLGHWLDSGDRSLGVRDVNRHAGIVDWLVASPGKEGKK